MRRFARALSSGILATLLACGGGVWVQKGDELLRQGRYDEAIRAYDRALRDAPGDDAAKAGIARARREQALAIIIRAEKELDGGRFVEAMREALRARSMPLDLDDVSLARRIDRTIERISANSDDQVQRWLAEERYLDAVALAEQLLTVDESRRDWAVSVRERAVDYYRRSAEAARTEGYPGTAALRYAIARDVGGEVDRGTIEAAWESFRGPNCFADPEVTTRVARRTNPVALERIRAVVEGELEALQSRCGVGGLPLRVEISVDEAEIRDREEERLAAEPLPGVAIETEEVYYEEVPYTDVEEVTTYETRIETVEHRDCAPRPGQRGCRTWTEEVERRVPKVERREVHKIRRVERRRPVKTPLPDDQVVRYPETVVTRAVRYRGTLGLAGTKLPFEVYEESTDSAHDAVNERGVRLPSDPLEVRSMDEVLDEADALLRLETSRAIRRIVAARNEALDARGGELTLDGKPDAAEEAYLAKLVTGGEVSREIARYFERRYGRGVSEVMKSLLVALGRVEEDEPSDAPGLFPEREDEPGDAPGSAEDPELDPLPVESTE